MKNEMKSSSFRAIREMMYFTFEQRMFEIHIHMLIYVDIFWIG